MIKEYIFTLYEQPYGEKFFMTAKIYAFDREQAERRLNDLCYKTNKHWANLEELEEVPQFVNFKDGCFDLLEELNKEEKEWEETLPF